jgi:predicted XRE-type DNA-binding protein
MTSQRKKALEAAGFKVGTVQEFLGLSDAEMQVIEIRVRLAKALRALRQKKRLSQADVARLVESSQARVATMENGGSGATLDLLVRALVVLGMTPRQLGSIVAKAA